MAMCVRIQTKCQSGCCTSTFDSMQPNCPPFDFTAYCTISGEQGEHVSCALNVARLEGSRPASAIQGVFHWDPGELGLLDLSVLIEVVGIGDVVVSYAQFPGSISVAPTPVIEASDSLATVIASQPGSTSRFRLDLHGGTRVGEPTRHVAVTSQ